MKRYFRILIHDLKEAFLYFRLRRIFLTRSKRTLGTILITPNIENFDKPDMYISYMETPKIIKKFKIDPETLDNYGEDGKGTACVGFSPKYQKWYGWSYRAIYGFGIGDVVAEGDITTTSGYVEDFELEHPDIAFKNVLPIGFKAETLEDAKKMAIAFAAAVS